MTRRTCGATSAQVRRPLWEKENPRRPRKATSQTHRSASRPLPRSGRKMSTKSPRKARSSRRLPSTRTRLAAGNTRRRADPLRPAAGVPRPATRSGALFCKVFFFVSSGVFFVSSGPFCDPYWAGQRITKREMWFFDLLRRIIPTVSHP